MLTTKLACDLARALAEVTEQDHFGSDAFRTPGGIFATVWHETRTVNLKLTSEQQRRFVELDGEGFSEIDNAWGRQGWTTANLEFLEREPFADALRTAWQNSQDSVARRLSKRRTTGKKTKSKKSTGGTKRRK
jgi:YjbR protein